MPTATACWSPVCQIRAAWALGWSTGLARPLAAKRNAYVAAGWLHLQLPTFTNKAVLKSGCMLLAWIKAPAQVLLSCIPGKDLPGAAPTPGMQVRGVCARGAAALPHRTCAYLGSNPTWGKSSHVAQLPANLRHFAPSKDNNSHLRALDAFWVTHLCKHSVGPLKLLAPTHLCDWSLHAPPARCSGSAARPGLRDPPSRPGARASEHPAKLAAR
jgi:hypothetical protein